MRKAFTLVELLVVIGMIAILAGAAGTAVVGAQKRAKIAKAQTEAQELTNAILAYANYDEEGELTDFGNLEDTDADESNLKYVLGKGPQKRGAPVPVLYNASTSRDGKFVDPWGHPYRVTVRRGQVVNPPGVPAMNVGVFYPNWHRLGEGERQ